MRKKLLTCVTGLSLLLSGCGQQSAKTDTTPQYIESYRDFYENGLIYPKEWNIGYFLDLDTMECAPLCAVPNCSHYSAGCLAQLLGSTPVLYNIVPPINS